MTLNVLITVIFVIVVVAIVVWIVTVSLRARRASEASDARLASQLQMIADNPPAAKPFASETPAERSEAVVAAAEDPTLVPEDATPASLKAERLAELGELHAKGLISDEELATARAKILAE
jgi:cytoskeletal protein RodZ